MSATAYGQIVTKRRISCKLSAEEQAVFEEFFDEYIDALGPVESDIERFVRQATDNDLSSLQTIRGHLESQIADYDAEFETVFRAGGRQGAEAGRTVTSRRFGLDIAFDVVPERTLAEIDDWVEVAAESTLETITEDSARWLRGAHEEGLGIDDIADQLNTELFEGRLEDHVAERAARTGTISTSNAGSHSAHEDAPGVIGEEWLTELDGRERDSHADADGQVVAVDNPFEVGDVYLEHPGDPSGPIGEIVNCRCAVLPVFEDDLTGEQREAIEAGERIWIR